MKYLLEFLTGSSPIVFIPYFIFVYTKVNVNSLDFDYFTYSLLMPIVYGLWNVLGKYFQDIFKYSNVMRFFVISTISFISLASGLLFFNLYNYNFKQWIKHLLNVYIFYLVTYFVIINTTEKLVLNKSFGKFEIKVVLSIIFISVIQQIILPLYINVFTV